MRFRFGLLPLLAALFPCAFPGSPGAEPGPPPLEALPPYVAPAGGAPAPDWLVHPVSEKAAVFRSPDGKGVILANGLVRREIRLAPNAATVSLENLRTGESLLRAVKPEAMVTLNGKEYAVGGLKGQPDMAYLRPEWLETMTADPAAFQFAGFKIAPIGARLPWIRNRRAEDHPWPPPGTELTLRFAPPADQAAGPLAGIEVQIHYEIYEGLPLLCKWLTLTNSGPAAATLDGFRSEQLALVETESSVDERMGWRPPNLNLFSDYAFGGMDCFSSNRVMLMLPDPEYVTQVNYKLNTPALMVSRAPNGPAAEIAAGGRFDSFRTWLLVHDDGDRERQGLAIRRMTRALAPWVTENPLMLHVRQARSDVFRNAVDQCAAVGFEMIIYTFGSGLNMENTDPAYMAKIKADIDYAHSKGIEVGGYSLLASRRINDEEDAVNPATGKPGGAIFGDSPCLQSRWGIEYFNKIKTFISTTGMDLLEHDGSYPGDLCASTEHPGHKGLADSQWRQWEAITDLYRWCRERGIYLNVPDHYFLAGSNKTGMGYRETNWSLPRMEQIIHGRQNIYDGTWTKTPSMGWMFVPLVEYQGGGEAATLEPLKDHLDAYDAHLVNNLAAGVQACYRGPRLYDSDETKEVVRKRVAWFKEYRDILESDIIHVSRADARGVDCLLHVNPALERRAMAVVFNPAAAEAKTTLRLPLYYSGLTGSAEARVEGGAAKSVKLAPGGAAHLDVTVPANGFTWVVFRGEAGR